jgi:uncharacterized RDD family membrane protein YckC
VSIASGRGLVTDTGDTGAEPDRRGVPAGIVTRALAFVIDATLITVVWGVTAFVLQAVATVLGVDVAAARDSDRAVAVLTSGVTSVLVYNTLLVGGLGKTVGMLVMGLRVVRVDGSPPGLFRAFVRTIAYFPSGLLLVGFLWIAVDNRRQSWPDKIARTFVVYDWQASPGSLRPPRIGEPLVPRW